MIQLVTISIELVSLCVCVNVACHLPQSHSPQINSFLLCTLECVCEREGGGVALTMYLDITFVLAQDTQTQRSTEKSSKDKTKSFSLFVSSFASRSLQFCCICSRIELGIGIELGRIAIPFASILKRFSTFFPFTSTAVYSRFYCVFYIARYLSFHGLSRFFYYYSNFSNFGFDQFSADIDTPRAVP